MCLFRANGGEMQFKPKQSHPYLKGSLVGGDYSPSPRGRDVGGSLSESVLPRVLFIFQSLPDVQCKSFFYILVHNFKPLRRLVFKNQVRFPFQKSILQNVEVYSLFLLSGINVKLNQ